MTFVEIVDKINNYKYPMNAAFVCIWWDIQEETEIIINKLKSIGYKVNTIFDRRTKETEIRFSYTHQVAKHFILK